MCGAVGGAVVAIAAASASVFTRGDRGPAAEDWAFSATIAVAAEVPRVGEKLWKNFFVYRRCKRN